MNASIKARTANALISALVPALCLWQPLVADELSELYLNSVENNTNSTIAPNLLFIIDTSSSMVDRPGFFIDPVVFYDGVEYDSTVTYPGDCDSDHLFRISPTLNSDGSLKVNEFGYPIDSSGEEERFQSCSNTHLGFAKSTFVCKAALTALDGPEGWWHGGIAEFRPKRTYFDKGVEKFYRMQNGVEVTGTSGEEMDGRWHGMSSHTGTVETYNGEILYRDCPDDIGIHGAIEGSTYKYPSHNSVALNGYHTFPDSSAGNVVNGVSKHVLVSGNFLNWYELTQTRLAAVQIAIREILRSLPGGTRVGLMRFDADTYASGDTSEGGMMIHHFVGTDTVINTDQTFIDGPNSASFIGALFAIRPWEGSGTTLAESLLEGLYVFRGDAVHFGAISNVRDKPPSFAAIPMPSVPESRESTDPGSPNYAYYKSPMQLECQKNAIVLLSDGDPSSDSNVWYSPGDFSGMPNVGAYSSGNCGSQCLEEVAAYLAGEDHRTDILGEQTVTTHVVGFGPEISSGGRAYLQNAASAGGGSFTQANSFDELKNAFKVIIREEIAENVSLSSPAVTVNAFQRLAHNKDIYFTLFDPSFDSLHWPGNLKKYQLMQSGDIYRIAGADGDFILAKDSSEIVHDALSYWTDPSDPEVAANQGHDGNKTTLGGAAGELTGTHLTRNIYSWYGDTTNRNLASPANDFTAANTSPAMLGLSPMSLQEAQLVAWVSGTDTSRSDWATNPKPRRSIGSAPHGVPAIVTYGGSESSPVQAIYVPTNDGFLHAFDTNSGQELWSFVPTEVMSKFADQFQVPADPYIGYGLDGSVIPSIESGDDATISGSGEYARLYFGMRRGGSAVYALDVTDRFSPKLMWRIQGRASSGPFRYLAQTWSEPQLARIRQGTSDEEGRQVVIFGGGYDETVQDSTAAGSGYLDDGAGNAVYIIDAETGALLWWAGPAGSGADLELPDLRSSIAAGIELKDKDEDGFIDLLYAVDLGGRIFRFDLDPASAQVSAGGGMIASLGGGASASAADNRKFFAKPDVVLVARGGPAYWAINVGSGDRERPKSNMTTDNWLFSVKDPNVFLPPSNYGYGIGIDDLYDVTDNVIQEGGDAEQQAARTALASAAGWKLHLGFAGEKALAEAKTFDFQVFFTTFDPQPLDNSGCKADPGRARLYSLDLLTGGAVRDRNGNGLDASDRITDLTHNTIPPALTFLFLENEHGIVEAHNIIGRSDNNAELRSKANFRKTYWYMGTDGSTEQ